MKSRSRDGLAAKGPKPCISRGDTPIWKGPGFSPEIKNETPSGDQSRCGLYFIYR